MDRPDFSKTSDDQASQRAADGTDDLLDRYLAGRARERERVAVEQLIASTPGMAEWITQLREIQAREDSAATADVGRGWERVAQRIGIATQYPARHVGVEPPPRATRLAPRSAWQRAWPAFVGIAAVLVLLCVGVLTHGGLMMARHTAKSSYTTYTTTDGQRANITLSDGSTVALNVASRLDVPVNYERGDRALRLRGEALFTVHHRSTVPFTVLAGGTTTQVLGTSFVVRHYDSDTIVTVAVREGKVAVRSIALSAGRQVVVSRHGVASVGTADPAQFGFVSGVLVIPGMSLAQAIPELDRWYGADIRLGDPALGAQRIHGKLAAGSLAELQAMLEWTYNVRVVRDGRVLILFPR